VNRRPTLRRAKVEAVALIGLCAAVGSVLALTFFAFLRAKGADPLIAYPLTLGAFFFGFVLVTLVRRIVVGIAYLWRMRR
jgi:hypothetical protein